MAEDDDNIITPGSGDGLRAMIRLHRQLARFYTQNPVGRAHAELLRRIAEMKREIEEEEQLEEAAKAATVVTVDGPHLDEASSNKQNLANLKFLKGRHEIMKQHGLGHPPRRKENDVAEDLWEQLEAAVAEDPQKYKHWTQGSIVNRMNDKDPKTGKDSW
jgi:hypothetical protein